MTTTNDNGGHYGAGWQNCPACGGYECSYVSPLRYALNRAISAFADNTLADADLALLFTEGFSPDDTTHVVDLVDAAETARWRLKCEPHSAVEYVRAKFNAWLDSNTFE